MVPVYVVCPANVVTGGPELLHQLADVLNRSGRRAYMLYEPFDRAHSTPAAYEKYQAPVAQADQVEDGARIVFPEVLHIARQMRRFPSAQTYLWWLSVDNFFNYLKDTTYKKVIPRRILAATGLRKVRSFDYHLYQSEYARLFLEAQGFSRTAHLGDYLNEGYLSYIDSPSSGPRENLIAYNPAKGRQQTEAILRRLTADGHSHIKAVPIVKMTRADVVDLLSRAKLYIDFGGHPGKDRIPREAAALGACIIVNRRGSAANRVDVPIPDEYKIDDTKPGFEREAVAKILTIMSDFDDHKLSFDQYRSLIAEEPAEFARQAAEIFS